MSRMMQSNEQGGSWDLEAFEMGLREAVHRLGAAVVEKLLEAEGGGYRGTQVECDCGAGCRFTGYRAKTLMTVLGRVGLRRAYYWCPDCGAGQIPLDQQLDVVGTGLSPGARRLAARVGAKEPYREAAEDLKELAGVEIGAKGVERVSKEVGAQMEALREQEEGAIWQQLSVGERTGEPTLCGDGRDRHFRGGGGDTGAGGTAAAEPRQNPRSEDRLRFHPERLGLPGTTATRFGEHQLRGRD